ncbi:putative DNA topoisomerase [Helianthus anomalus]
MNLILVYVIKDKLDIRKTLEEEARKCQWLVLWLDCDREGENIAYEVVEVCLNVNSRLNFWRVRFSSLIDRYDGHIIDFSFVGLRYVGPVFSVDR